jgi:hypothetical protein
MAATIRASVMGSPASGERIGIVAASASLRHVVGLEPRIHGSRRLPYTSYSMIPFVAR